MVSKITAPWSKNKLRRDFVFYVGMSRALLNVHIQHKGTLLVVCTVNVPFTFIVKLTINQLWQMWSAEVEPQSEPEAAFEGFDGWWGVTV